jgi:hypothetical protein
VVVLAAGLLAWYTASADSSEPPPASPAASSSVTSVAPTTAPTTIAGVIAALQADPEAYGQHSEEIIDELAKIERGDAPSQRAATLLSRVTTWTESGEVTPDVLALIAPVLQPLITSPPTTAAPGGDGGGNGKGKGNGNGKGKRNG